MTIKKLKVTKNEYKNYDEYFSLFSYKKYKQIECGEDYYKLTYIQEDEISPQLKIIEAKYPLRRIIPIWPIFVIAGLIVILATLFLIFININIIDKLVGFYSFMLPAFILVILDAILLCNKYLSVSNNIKTISSLDLIRKEVLNANISK